MTYDHRREVEALRAAAREARALAEKARAEAEVAYEVALSHARALELQAAYVHRLCTRGGDGPCCGLLPGSDRPSP